MFFETIVWAVGIIIKEDYKIADLLEYTVSVCDLYSYAFLLLAVQNNYDED